MNLKHTVAALLVLAGLSGAIDGYASSRGIPVPRPVDFAFSIAVMVLSYLWYRRDAIARQYRGGVFLGGAIILIGFVGIPYYLFRSRPRGARGKSVAKFFGLVALCAIVAGLASVPFELATGG